MADPEAITQAVAAGVVTGAGSFSAIRWSWRDVKKRVAKCEECGEELKARVAAQEGETRISHETLVAIKNSVTAVHRRLDDYQEKTTSEMKSVARELGGLTEAVRHLTIAGEKK